MILTITPNPALDLTWHAPAVHQGKSHRVDAGVSRAGGKGLNVARVLHSQAIPVTAVTTAGGPTGRELADDLERSGIPSIHIPVAGDTRRSIAIIDDAAGDATLFNEHGAPLSGHEVMLLLGRAAALSTSARTAVISGSLPPGLAPADVGTLVASIVAMRRPVVADLSGEALRVACAAGATVVKPNLDELRSTTGEDDPLSGARALQRLGARIVVASLGADGLIVLSPDGRHVQARLARRLAGNPTGAGDAAVAAIAEALAEAHDVAGGAFLDAVDPDRIARRAVAWSASAVMVPVAGALHPDHPSLEREIIFDH